MQPIDRPMNSREEANMPVQVRDEKPKCRFDSSPELRLGLTRGWSCRA